MAKGRLSKARLQRMHDIMNGYVERGEVAGATRIDFSRPGKPTDNAHIETFKGSLRDECLNLHWFETIDEARRLIEAWCVEYNESHPHMALGNMPPAEYAL
jgi:transposase InsO family protein